MLIPLVLAAALMNAAMVAASAVSTILIADTLSTGLSGLPNTAGVLGTAAGAMAVGRWSARLGRAQALRLGYGVGVSGGALTVLASVGAPVLLLFLGMFLLGAGNAASLLSRYAAAEVVAPTRRAAAMSTVVWASTAGAVGGPFLLEPTENAATSAGLPPLSGPFLLAVVATFAALLAASRIRPPQAFPTSELSNVPAPTSPRTTLVVAAGVMLVGQLVMVALMTSVPVHAHQHGQGLGMLGLMLSAHTLGMFALSPVTGWLIGRAGPKPVMLAGLATISAAAFAVAGLAGTTFPPALFVLGYGWNLCYLGGSAFLTQGAAISAAARSVLESRVEALVWTVSALATAGSTWLFVEGGFHLLAIISVVLTLPTLIALVMHRPAKSPAVEDLAECPHQTVSTSN